MISNHKGMNLSLTKKLVMFMAFMMLIIFTLLTIMIVTNSYKRFYDVSENESLNVLHSAQLMIDMTEASINSTIASASGSAVLHFYKNLHVDKENIVKVGDFSVPAVYYDDRSIYSDYSAVDEFKKAALADVTIFVKNASGDFIRVATTLITPDGSRAVGTKLAAGAALNNIMKGAEFQGRAVLFQKNYITKYVPVMDGKEVIAIIFVGVEIESDLDALRQTLRELNLGETGYLFIVDTSKDQYGTLVVHTTMQGDNILDIKDASGNAIFEKILKLDNGTLEYELPVGNDVKSMIANYVRYPAWEWQIIGAIPRAELTSNADALRGIMIIFSIVFLILSVILNIFVARWVVGKPIALFIKSVENLTSGDGDLTKQVEVHSRDELALLADNFNTFLDNMRHVITEVINASDSVASGNTELAATMEEMSTIFDEQTNKISTMYSHMGEIANVSTKASTNMEATIGLVNAASEKTDEGRRHLTDVIGSIENIKEKTEHLATTISSLSESTDHIGEILSVINDIAGQTNLLALNAAIEAARAGDAGRGFAVVADEVRKLAERTQKATGEISGIIVNLQNASGSASSEMQNALQSVSDSVVSVNVTNQSFDEIVSMVSAIEKNSTEVAGEVSEQYQLILANNTEMEDVRDSIAQSNVAVGEITKTVHHLQDLSSQLKHMVSKFKV